MDGADSPRSRHVLCLLFCHPSILRTLEPEGMKWCKSAVVKLGKILRSVWEDETGTAAAGAVFPDKRFNRRYTANLGEDAMSTSPAPTVHQSAAAAGIGQRILGCQTTLGHLRRSCPCCRFRRFADRPGDSRNYHRGRPSFGQERVGHCGRRFRMYNSEQCVWMPTSCNIGAKRKRRSEFQKPQ